MKDAREITYKKIELAFNRLKRGRGRTLTNAKVNISNVAKEAGISPSTIHNRYPDLASRIRVYQGKTDAQLRRVQHDKLRKAIQRIREYRAEIDELKGDLSKLASINAQLILEINTLTSTKNLNNVTEFKGK